MTPRPVIPNDFHRCPGNNISPSRVRAKNCVCIITEPDNAFTSTILRSTCDSISLQHTERLDIGLGICLLYFSHGHDPIEDRLIFVVTFVLSDSEIQYRRELSQAYADEAQEPTETGKSSLALILHLLSCGIYPPISSRPEQ